jgi:thioredoxin-related protein
VNVDGNRELSKLYGVRGIPYVVVISPDGKIIRSQTGAMPSDRFLSWLP